MKYRAILLDPGNVNQERPVQLLTNSMQDIETWAYGSSDGGMERARGVLPGAVSEAAVVKVFAIEERQIALMTKKGKPQ